MNWAETVQIRQETPQDWWEVEALYDLCFAPGREALSSYRFRNGVNPVTELCLVADDTGTIGGAIRFWPIEIDDLPALLLGPIAVHPTRQGEGLGSSLILEGLSVAEQLTWERILLVGDEPYYGRFGFKRLSEVIMPSPTNPDRVLGFGKWDGVSGEIKRARS